MKEYKFLEHTADLKFRAYGKTLEKVFENAALAISEILSRGDRVESAVIKDIEIKADDNESMLYDFIDELIYLLDAERFIVSKAKIKIKDGKLNGKIYGDDALKYPNLDSIKAATYAEMYVKKKKDGWEAQIVVDV